MSLDVSLFEEPNDGNYVRCEYCDAIGYWHDTSIYANNITHNLKRMAEAASIYKCLWRPDEVGITKAKQLIEPLKEGLEKLQADPEHFKKFNPPNGWGNYEGLVSFVADYLEACIKSPEANVRTSI